MSGISHFCVVLFKLRNSSILNALNPTSFYKQDKLSTISEKSIYFSLENLRKANV